MLQLHLILLLFLQVLPVFSNTEKVIFVGPSSLKIPVQHPTLEDLQLEALSPHHASLRTRIQAQFPSAESIYGQHSWYLLHGLTEGQRYEVRICWAATQPTSFRLDAYEITAVFNTPELITSLAQYSETRQPKFDEIQRDPLSEADDLKSTYDGATSTLFLHVQAAADYYTMNQTLMHHVEPVLVDIILDPFVFNVFPRSLIPTGAYITILAIGSWFLSKKISDWISKIAAISSTEKKNS